MFGYCEARITDTPWSTHQCPRLARRTVNGKLLCAQHAKIETQHGGTVRTSP